MRFAARLACLITVFSILAPSILGQDDSTSDKCGQALGSTDDFLPAVDAYACLTSTPFRSDVAKQLLDYWRTTMSFQSTLAYLRDPPASYQQPAVDLIRGLDSIRQDIDNGVFSNQYAFEAAVQGLFYSVHDSHVQLVGSVMGVFKFAAPFDLATISLDGASIPRVYAATDIYAWSSSPGYTPSPLKRINQDIAEAYLAVYASQKSLGYVEPHADWNAIMYSPTTATILNENNYWTWSDFYPGENITIEFENGTVYGPVPWKAYNYQGYGIPSIKTGEDFYEYFVLGQAPESSSDGNGSGSGGSDEVLTDDSYAATDAPSATTTGDGSAATDASTSDSSSNDDSSEFDDEDDFLGWGAPYPAIADVAQPGLGYGGVITGYFLNDTKIGVLSIPSFQPAGGGSETFSDTIGEFLRRSKAADMQKIVIDLQQNSGGVQLLATDTFHQFFPGIQPFSGMRTRSFDLANELGTTFTNILAHNSTGLQQSDIDSLIEDPFAVTSEINADNNQNFTSWAEYFGPHPDRNDQFSTVFTYNLSNSVFTENAGGLVIYGFGNRTTKDPAPYSAGDIILLTDGACGSTCDLFVELMHHEAGVRTITVGGLPQLGSMQARGSRGALFYSSNYLDADMDFGCASNSSLCNALPNRNFSAVTQSSLTFNLADQIRAKEYTPLQFTYEAADCRIFWTPSTFQNFTTLWQYAADANWVNTSLCVAHSVEHNNTMQTDLWGPSAEQKKAWAATNPAWISDKNASMMTPIDNLAQLELGPGLHEAWKEPDKIIGTYCQFTSDCKLVNQYRCRLVERCTMDGNQPTVHVQNECRMPCSPGSTECPPQTVCVRDVTFKKGAAGRGTDNWFCERKAQAGTQFCQKAANAVTALPAAATAVNGQMIDVDFNN